MDEVTPELGPRALRWHGLGREDLHVAGDPSHGATMLEEVVQAPRARDVVVGEIELSDAGTRQGEVVLGHVALEESELDHPVDLTLDGRVITGVDCGHRAGPQVDHTRVDALRILEQASSLCEVPNPVEILGLDLER